MNKTKVSGTLGNSKDLTVRYIFKSSRFLIHIEIGSNCRYDLIQINLSVKTLANPR